MKKSLFARVAFLAISAVMVCIAPVANAGVNQIFILEGSPIEFGPVAPFTTATRTLTIQANTNNAGTSTGSATVPAGWSRIGGTCAWPNYSLAANTTCTIIIQFNGAASTPANAPMTFSCGVGGAPLVGATINCNNLAQTGATFAATVLAAVANVAVPALTPLGLTGLLLGVLAIAAFFGLRRRS